MSPEILSDREKLPAFIIDQLKSHPLDYSTKMQNILSDRRNNKVHQPAGVLLPIYFSEDIEEYTFQLIKRSTRVSQPGDLSCPGGMLHPFLDPLLTPLTRLLIVPAKNSSAEKDAQTKWITNLFLTNALRESWEEIRIHPFDVDFLGALPTYSLSIFKRTIFPLVGLVKKSWRPRINKEVDKIIGIPISAFFDEDNYGHYALTTQDELNSWDTPCLIHTDDSGEEEILWGATLNIITSFLKIVFNFQMPEWESKRIITRVFMPEYVTGKK